MASVGAFREARGASNRPLPLDHEPVVFRLVACRAQGLHVAFLVFTSPGEWDDMVGVDVAAVPAPGARGFVESAHE